MASKPRGEKGLGLLNFQLINSFKSHLRPHYSWKIENPLSLALVRPLSRVASLVPLDHVGVGKGLGAVGAAVGPRDAVAGGHVGLQLGVGAAGGVAHEAGQAGLGFRGCWGLQFWRCWWCFFRF